MGYASVITACLAWLIASNLFNWRYSLPLDALLIRAFNLQGHAAGFIAIPLLWCWIALVLMASVMGAWALVTKSPQRRAGAAGIALTLLLAAVSAISMMSIAAGRTWD